MSDKGRDTGRKKVADGGTCLATNESSCMLSKVSVETGELDTLFSILSSRRRRWVLYSLVSSEEAVIERAELVDTILAHEQTDGPGEEPPPRTTLEIDLHHKILPRLEDEGYIDYDSRQGTVRYDGSPEQANCLDTIRILEQIGTGWGNFG